MINTRSIHNEQNSDFSGKSSVLVINCFPEDLKHNFKTFRPTEVKYFAENCRSKWEYILEQTLLWKGKRICSP